MLMLPSVVVRFRLRLGCGAVASRPQRSPDPPGRGRRELHFALVALVAQSSPSRNDDDQCRDAKDDSRAQVKRNGRETELSGGWKERLERGECVEASMKQDRHQHAAPGVIEHPSHDERKAYYAD